MKSPDRAEALMLAFANMAPGIMEYTRRLAHGKAVDEGVRKPLLERSKPNRLIMIYNAASRSSGSTNFIATCDEEDDDAGRRRRGYLATHACAVCEGYLTLDGNYFVCATDRTHPGVTTREPVQRPSTG